MLPCHPWQNGMHPHPTLIFTWSYQRSKFLHIRMVRCFIILCANSTDSRLTRYCSCRTGTGTDGTIGQTASRWFVPLLEFLLDQTTFAGIMRDVCEGRFNVCLPPQIHVIDTFRLKTFFDDFVNLLLHETTKILVMLLLSFLRHPWHHL